MIEKGPTKCLQSSEGLGILRLQASSKTRSSILNLSGAYVYCAILLIMIVYVQDDGE